MYTLFLQWLDNLRFKLSIYRNISICFERYKLAQIQLIIPAMFYFLNHYFFDLTSFISS